MAKKVLAPIRRTSSAKSSPPKVESSPASSSSPEAPEEKAPPPLATETSKGKREETDSSSTPPRETVYTTPPRESVCTTPPNFPPFDNNNDGNDDKNNNVNDNDDGDEDDDGIVPIEELLSSSVLAGSTPYIERTSSTSSADTEDTPLRSNLSLNDASPSSSSSSRLKEKEDNTTNGSSGSSGGGTIASTKVVSFAPSPPRDPFTNAHGSALSTESEKDIILRLKQDLEKAKVDLSAEKAVRRKKEKNLIKLAKQLNLRSGELNEKEKTIKQLLETQAELETKLESTKRELDELASKTERDARNHHSELTVMLNKFRDTCGIHDARVAELNAAHAKQCEELRRQILTTNLEADRLRMQLAHYEMRKNPKGAEKIMARTVRDSFSASKGKAFGMKRVFVCIAAFFSAVIISGLVIGYYRNLLSFDALCSPCIPGTELGNEHASFDAPWWAPSSAKTKAFDLICGDRIRTRLEWSGGSRMSKLHISELGKGGKKPHVLLRKKVESAVVHSEHIAVTIRGRNSQFASPWVRV